MPNFYGTNIFFESQHCAAPVIGIDVESSFIFTFVDKLSYNYMHAHIVFSRGVARWMPSGQYTFVDL